MLLELLASPINEGTGRAAALHVKAYGKTGTSQDNRDALFVGFAGDLVVGVWVGNDDNTPLRGINGGNVPAQIWKNFMAAAIDGAVPPSPTKTEDPGLENLTDMPPIELGNDATISINNDSSISLDANVGDVGINLKMDRDGLLIDARPPPDKAAPPSK